MKIGPDTVVAIHYTLKNDAGDVLDSSSGKDPLTYLHGRGAMIVGLERALEGKSAGDEFDAVVEPAEGFGDVDDSLIQEIPREAFQGVDDVAPGMQFRAARNDGSEHAVTVLAVEGDNVTVDANHPLAGANLNFSVSVKSVRAATDEEKSHGHVHD